VIPQEEIRKNQYQDMAGFLQNYGVQMDSFIPGQQAQVKIRGVFTSFPSDLGAQGGVLLLVDGRRIGTNNINMIPMVNIERIEILRGPAAVQYGSSAIGGVVNVITRRGTEDLSASVQAGAGSWDTYRGQGSLAWAQGPLDFSGGVSYMTAGNYYIGGNKKYPNTGMDGRTAFNVNTGFSFLDEHRIGVTVLGVDTNRVGSPYIIKDVTPQAYLDISSYSGDLLYEGGYKDFGLSWKARYFSGRENYYTKDPAEDILNFIFPYNMRTINDYQGAQGQLSFQKSFLTLTGGVDWLYSDVKKRSSGIDFIGPYLDKTKYENDNLGVFALAKIALLDDRLIVNAGVRHDAYRLKTRGDESGKKNLERVVPTFGVAVHPTDWLTLKGNYGESYRVPGALELLGFSATAWGGSTTLPNPDLKPEEAKSWDLGFAIEHKSLQFGLSYFETEYKRKIVTAPRLNWLDPAQYVNADGKIWYKGFEGYASYDIGEAFDWPVKLRPYVNFTALTERKASRGSQWASEAGLGNKVPNVSDLDVGYGVNFSHPGIGFEADLRFTYMGHQYNYADHDPVTNGAIYKRNGGTTIADLFLSQKIHSSDKGTFSAFGEIRNIGDVRYDAFLGYPQPGRSFFVGLRYDF
jgi:vitamin B12 transporter